MPDETRTKFFKDIFKQNIILQNLKNNELTPPKNAPKRVAENVSKHTLNDDLVETHTNSPLTRIAHPAGLTSMAGPGWPATTKHESLSLRQGAFCSLPETFI